MKHCWSALHGLATVDLTWAFYAPTYSVELIGAQYVGWRKATSVETQILRNYHPDLFMLHEKRKAFASYGHLRSENRYSKPRRVRTGPTYTRQRKPILGLRFGMRYLDDQGRPRAARVIYRFFDRDSWQRFRRFERQGFLPVPLTGSGQVDYGIRPWEYRLRRFSSRNRGSYLGSGPE